MSRIDRRTLMKAAAGSMLAMPFLTGVGLAQSGPLKIGFVLPGPKDDGGWSEAHVRGAQAVKDKFGDAVRLTFVEGIYAEPDVERVMRDLAQSGHMLIFLCTSSEALMRVARTLPDVRFEQCEGGNQTARNVAAYGLRTHEAHAVCGLIAGRMTKSGKIGLVSPFPVPNVRLALNAFTIMARKVNPAVTVTPAWLSTFYDPAKESDAARAFVAQGSDILYSHMDSPAVLQVAEQNGLHTFGLGKDMSQVAPKAHLTAIVYDWSVHYLDSVGKMLNGSWEPASSWLGMKDGAVKLAPYNPALPQNVVAEAESLRKGIVDGSLSPFDGPIKDNSGNEVVAVGARLDGNELRQSQWFAEGVPPQQ